MAGLRGDLANWHFVVQCSEDLALSGGRVENALHLQREALGPYDAALDVWLDPARQHLPVQLRQAGADGRTWLPRLCSEARAYCGGAAKAHAIIAPCCLASMKTSRFASSRS